MSMLEVENLSKRFGGVTAVDACSLSLQPGRITGLIGPNGSGKTTVFNLITGFVPKDSGEVRFNGQSLANFGPDRIYALGIGRTFQLARIFPRLTALENMLVPMRREGLRDSSPVGIATMSARARWTCSRRWTSRMWRGCWADHCRTGSASSSSSPP